jgi:hypothetical protein
VKGWNNKTLTRRETIQITENGWEIVSEEMHVYGGRWIEVPRYVGLRPFALVLGARTCRTPYDAAGEPDLPMT